MLLNKNPHKHFTNFFRFHLAINFTASSALGGAVGAGTSCWFVTEPCRKTNSHLFSYTSLTSRQFWAPSLHHVAGKHSRTEPTQTRGKLANSAQGSHDLVALMRHHRVVFFCVLTKQKNNNSNIYEPLLRVR